MRRRIRKSRKLLVNKNTRKNKKQHSYKWDKIHEKIEETNVPREALIKEIVEFLKKVLPTDTLHPSIIGKQTPRQVEKDIVLVFPSSSSTGDDVYVWTPKKLLSKFKI